MGSDELYDGVSVQTAHPQYVELHGHGNQTQSTVIHMFVPLAGQQPFIYAHQQMSRFGNTCNCSFNLTGIDGTYAVVDRLAILSDYVFGLHVTVSVKADDTLLSNFKDLAQCRAPKETWLPCISANPESQLV